MRRRELPGGIPPPTKGELKRQAQVVQDLANRLDRRAVRARRRPRPARQARGRGCACAPHQRWRRSRPPEAVRREADARASTSSRSVPRSTPGPMPRAWTRRGSGARNAGATGWWTTGRRRSRPSPRSIRGPIASSLRHWPPRPSPSAVPARPRARVASCSGTCRACSGRADTQYLSGSGCPRSSCSIVAVDGPRAFCSRAAACSAPRSTRRTLPRASFASAASVQPRRISSANSSG